VAGVGKGLWCLGADGTTAGEWEAPLVGAGAEDRGGRAAEGVLGLELGAVGGADGGGVGEGERAGNEGEGKGVGGGATAGGGGEGKGLGEGARVRGGVGGGDRGEDGGAVGGGDEKTVEGEAEVLVGVGMMGCGAGEEAVGAAAAAITCCYLGVVGAMAGLAAGIRSKMGALLACCSWSRRGKGVWVPYGSSSRVVGTRAIPLLFSLSNSISFFLFQPAPVAALLQLERKAKGTRKLCSASPCCCN
jgi:hypothetical protein